MGEEQREKQQWDKINISSPNLVSICVDENQDGELKGRIYQYYTEAPWVFENVVQLLRILERFYDNISFPQASLESRHFNKKHIYQPRNWEKTVEPETVLSQRGEKGTFVSCVHYRQNATWQGELFWLEKDVNHFFASSLEFIKLLDNALNA
ncbi:hypothetical protein K280104A7_31330 [Candidatus Bariatricus faecipullorum]